MKRILTIGLLAVSFGATACTGAPETNDPVESDEAAAEVAQPILQSDLVGAPGWKLDSGLTTDSYMDLIAQDTQNKTFTFSFTALYPALDGGPATDLAIDLCEQNVTQVLLFYHTPSSSGFKCYLGEWVHAVASISDGIITKCSMAYSQTMALTSWDQVKFEVLDGYNTGNAYYGNDLIPVWHRASISRP